MKEALGLPRAFFMLSRFHRVAIHWCGSLFWKEDYCRFDPYLFDIAGDTIIVHLINKRNKIVNGDIAPTGRAPALQAEGYEFESHFLHNRYGKTPVYKRE